RQWWRRFVLHDGQGSIGREQRQRRHHHRDAGRWPGQFRDYERGAQPHLCDSGGQVVHHRADLVVSVPGREWQLSDHVLRCDVVDSRRLQDWYHVVGERRPCHGTKFGTVPCCLTRARSLRRARSSSCPAISAKTRLCAAWSKKWMRLARPSCWWMPKPTNGIWNDSARTNASP